ncbi:MAG: hypothetical protein M1401_20685 [Chloroflexi bacterium]|nr:hypothetical protein [Chloroflexota bacterium]
MGFLDALFGAPKPQNKGGRPPGARSKPATEKLAREEARYLEHLRKTNPVKWAAIMEQRMGLSLQGPNDFEQFAETVKRMKEVGLLKSAKELAGEDDSFKDIIAAVAPVVTAVVQAQTAGAAQIAALAQQAALVQRQQALPPAAATAPTPEAAPKEDAAAPQSPPEMSMQARVVKATLERMNPQQAAEWLVELDHPQIDELVTIICQTADDRLPALLTSLGQKSPEFAGVLWWLAGRGPWLGETAAALRRLRGGESASGGQSSYSI